MEEKELQTSTKQRIFIAIIAVVMLGSMIAGYAAIIIGNNGNNNNTNQNSISEEKKIQYEEEYNTALTNFKKKSQKDFDKFIAFKKAIKAYNETTANENGVQTRDYVVGDGRTLTDGDTNYLAYYVGWCANETIFDSSYNDSTNPTAFESVLAGSPNMVEGWLTGIVGMKLNGIREITIPSSLAYKDQEVACGANKPLKFLVMTKATGGELEKLSKELDTARLKYVYATQYGIDYETIQQNEA
ncbi:FKBP-type peptidyl-prolyl cis-trans isomerase [Candidatus Saccharibacteria bacterium]|nr:FKBP-type peptidyl-prolyl cis-trans isomerase [Candidatus Saccharibacteria bacterium]